jgi:hypothetical protein
VGIYRTSSKCLLISFPEIADHPLIQGIKDPTDIKKGVSFVCSVPDAKKVIVDIPDLDVQGVLRSISTQLAVSLFLFSSCNMLILYIYKQI